MYLVSVIYLAMSLLLLLFLFTFCTFLPGLHFAQFLFTFLLIFFHTSLRFFFCPYFNYDFRQF